MTSFIYKTKKHHYVYQITELSSGIAYIGVRSSDFLPEQDLGKYYFSSSTVTEFISRQKQEPTDYKYEVLSNFNSRDEACSEEIRLHELHDVANNPKFYNKYNAKDTPFTADGMVVVSNGNGKYVLMGQSDPRFLSGEYRGVGHGMLNVRNEDGTHKRISCEEFKSGKYISQFKGQVTVKDSMESKCYNISKDDPRWINREVIHNTSGTVPVKIEDGSYIRVSRDDPRWISGELKHNCKDMITVKGNDGTFFNVHRDDPRYLSGELKHNCTGMVNVIDRDGIGKQITKEEFDENRHLYATPLEGRLKVFDENGNTSYVEEGDSRLLSGELFTFSDKRYKDLGLSAHNKNRIIICDKDGKKYMVKRDDKRLKDKDYHLSGTDEFFRLTRLKYEKANVKKGKLYNDGNVCRKFADGVEIPPGWVLGRIR